MQAPVPSAPITSAPGVQAVQRARAIAERSAQATAARTLQAKAERAFRAAATGNVVQRVPKIGFEMEDGDWRSWIWQFGWFSDRYYKTRDESNGVRPARRKEVLHQGTGFELEADAIAEDGELRGDIEFVTHPFPLNRAGYGALRTALAQIDQIYRRIGPLHGRDHAVGEFVTHDEHRLSNTYALLSKGKADAQLNLQATSGLSLSDIPKVYFAMAEAPERATPAYRDAFMNIQFGNVRHDDSRARPELRSVREAPWRAYHFCVSYLDERLPPDDARVIAQTGAMPLFGLLTALMGFLRAMRSATVQGGMKTVLPLMHRNDFATLFALLPRPVQAVLRANRQVFIDAVIFGVLADFDHDFGPEGVDFDRADPTAHRDLEVVVTFLTDRDLRHQFFEGESLPTSIGIGEGRIIGLAYAPLRQFTVQEWITDWMDGRAPADLLTEAQFGRAAQGGAHAAPIVPLLDQVRQAMPVNIAGIIDWNASTVEGASMVRLRFAYARLTPEQRRLLDAHARGLGGLGGDIDRNGGEELALFENRAMSPVDRLLQNHPTKVPMAIAEESVLTYFRGMVRLLNPDLDR